MANNEVLHIMYTEEEQRAIDKHFREKKSGTLRVVFKNGSERIFHNVLYYEEVFANGE